MKRKKYLGIHVAQLILSGDVDAARKWAGTRRTWNVPEARAISGACRAVQKKGWPVSFESFL